MSYAKLPEAKSQRTEDIINDFANDRRIDLDTTRLDLVKPHLEAGEQTSVLAYADDTAFLLSSEDTVKPRLHSFSQAAATFGLRTSWAKTDLNNLGSGLSIQSADRWQQR